MIRVSCLLGTFLSESMLSTQNSSVETQSKADDPKLVFYITVLSFYNDEHAIHQLNGHRFHVVSMLVRHR